ncbi:hypothetical protein IMZ48_24475, partial [Candidatus Bathyarchaeota archaeon]|nr:hypothetical protein [Candidatus Bathyarchaeota archaeon]
MPISEACLRARLLVPRRAPLLLPTRVAIRRMSAPAIPSRSDHSQPAKERPEFRRKGDFDRDRRDKNVAIFRGVVGGGADEG